MRDIYEYNRLNEKQFVELLKKAEHALLCGEQMPVLDISKDLVESLLERNASNCDLIVPMLPRKILEDVEFWKGIIPLLSSDVVQSYLKIAPENVKNNKEFISIVLEKCNFNADFKLTLGSTLADDKDWIIEEIEKTRYIGDDAYLNNRPIKFLREDLNKEAAVALILLTSCSPRLKEDEAFQLMGNEHCCKGFQKYAARPGNKLMKSKRFIINVLKINPFFYGELYIPPSEFLSDEEVAFTFINSFTKYIQLGEVWSWNFLYDVRGCTDRRITKIFNSLIDTYKEINDVRLDTDRRTFREKCYIKYANRLIKKANKIAIKRAEEEDRVAEMLTNIKEELNGWLNPDYNL